MLCKTDREKERQRERVRQTERRPDRFAKNRVRKPYRTVPPSWRYELIPYRTRYGQFLGHTITVTVIEPNDAIPHIPNNDIFPRSYIIEVLCLVSIFIPAMFDYRHAITSHASVLALDYSTCCLTGSGGSRNL